MRPRGKEWVGIEAGMEEPPEHRVINGRIRSGLNIPIYCLLGRRPILPSYSIGIAMGPIRLYPGADPGFGACHRFCPRNGIVGRDSLFDSPGLSSGGIRVGIVRSRDHRLNSAVNFLPSMALRSCCRGRSPRRELFSVKPDSGSRDLVRPET